MPTQSDAAQVTIIDNIYKFKSGTAAVESTWSLVGRVTKDRRGSSCFAGR